MLIKAYRIESRRHGSIDCQPVLMGIVHFTEGIDQDQLFEQERVAVNLVMDHSPFSHDVKRGAETYKHIPKNLARRAPVAVVLDVWGASP
jgi:hypothetical protein